MKEFKSIGAGKLEVKFQLPGNLFQEALTLIKSIQGREWVASKKVWLVPDTAANRQVLLDSGFSTKGELSAPMEDLPKPIIAEVDKSRLHKDLHPYQLDGVGFLLARGGSGILSWEVGTGKSLGAISYCVYAEHSPVIIFCPSAVKSNWEREIKKWAGKKSVKLYGKTPHKLPKVPFVIINYDILGNPQDDSWCNFLARGGFKVAILDECHYVKNSSAKRTKAVLHIVKNISNKIFLSGTIIKNRTSDLYVPLHCLDPVNFPNEYKFLHTYCDPKYNGFSWVFKGMTNEQDLMRKMNPLMHSIKKRDVLKDLPERQTFTIPMEVDTVAKKKYDRASELFIEWVNSTEEKKKADGKAHMETLRALAFQMKYNSLVMWIEDFLESGEKLIVFTVHKNAIDALCDTFKKALKIDGRTTSDRQVIVDKFTNDEDCQLLIGQIDAAGVGLNLQVASNVVIAEIPYVLSSIEQATGRVDRLGQKASTVTTWIPFAPDTVEADIALILEEKRGMSDIVLNGGKKSDIFGMDIEDLIMLSATKRREE